jgi:hypothetical protein
MSEHQPQRQSRNSRESKRDRLAEIRMDETLDDEQVRRLTRKHSPWSDWLLNEYLQYWYWIIVLAINVFPLMDIAQRYHVRDFPGIAGMVSAFIAATAVEYFAFVKIWPEREFKWFRKDA